MELSDFVFLLRYCLVFEMRKEEENKTFFSDFSYPKQKRKRKMQFADFKHQREINEILQRNNPLAQVLVKVNAHLIPFEKEGQLTHPSTFARGPQGKLIEIPFDPTSASSPTGNNTSSQAGGNLTRADLAAVGGPTSQQQQSYVSPFDVVSEATTEVSIAHPLNEDLDVFSLIDERRMLERGQRRKSFQMKRLLYKEIQFSQARLNLCRNGMTDPFDTASSTRGPTPAPSSPITALAATSDSSVGFLPWKMVGTLGEVMEVAVANDDGENKITPLLGPTVDPMDDLAAPSALTKRKSFFFTEEDVDETDTKKQNPTNNNNNNNKNSNVNAKWKKNRDPDLENEGSRSFSNNRSSSQRGASRVILPPVIRTEETGTFHSSHSMLDNRSFELSGNSPIPEIHANESHSDLSHNFSFGSVSHSQLQQQQGGTTAAQEAEMQRQREEYLKYPDVQASSVLMRRDRKHAPNNIMSTSTAQYPLTSQQGAGGGVLLPPLPTTASNRLNTGGRTNTESQPHQASMTDSSGVADAAPQEVPLGDRRRANFQFSFRTADAFVERWHEALRRRKAEQQIKYTKKYKALDLHRELPFRASANAILHHVEHMIIKEERASAWRDAHNAVKETFLAMETYVLQHFHHPVALQLVQEARKIIVNEEQMPQKNFFTQRILPLVPHQLFLLDEVTTVAAHVGVVFEVPREEVVRLIRGLARVFIVDHCDALVANLQ